MARVQTGSNVTAPVPLDTNTWCPLSPPDLSSTVVMNILASSEERCFAAEAGSRAANSPLSPENCV